MKTHEVGQVVRVEKIGSQATDGLRARVGQVGEVVEAVGLIQVGVRFADGVVVDFDPLRDNLKIVKEA